MAKWAGIIGYSETVEIEPGLWEPTIAERMYCGDMLSNRWKRHNSDGVNDEIALNNQISIVSDSYAFEHFSFIAYVEVAGNKWKVSDVEIQYPRLILTLGGVYND